MNFMNKFHISAILLLAFGMAYSTVNLSCSSQTSPDVTSAGAADSTATSSVSTGSGDDHVGSDGSDRGVCHDETTEGFVTLPDGSIEEIPVPELCDPHASDLGRPDDVVNPLPKDEQVTEENVK